MILIITRLTINGVIMIACHQITQIARSLHQVVIRWCSRVQRRWQRWSHWILANKKSDARQEKNPPLQLRKSGCSHRLGFLDQHRWQTRNYKYFKALQISAHVEHLHRITLWEGWKAHLKTTRSTKRSTGSAPNAQPRSQSVDPLPMMVLYLGRRMSASSVPLPPKPQRFLN